MRVWNKIFKDIELADYLKVSLQAVRQYPKDKLGLMRLGFACKKLDLNYDDLIKISELKKKDPSNFL